jgi:hypothetical protein
MDVTTLLEDLKATRDETLVYYDLSDTELSRNYGPGKWSVRYSSITCPIRKRCSTIGSAG